MKEKDKNEITREYESEDLIVYWKKDLCIHSGECVKGSPKVFNMNKRPWIDLSGEEAEATIKTIDKCPSGALSYKIKKEKIKEKSNE